MTVPATAMPSRRWLIAIALAWTCTRGIVLWLYLGRHSWVTGDIAYFAQSLARVDEVGLGSTLVEYPLPGVVVIALPWLLASLVGIPDAYGDVVLALSMLADAAFTALLVAHRPRRGGAAVVVWILAVPLLGATAYARFDLVPSVLAAVGLLLLESRTRVAATAAALATGFKLWPAVLVPALAAPTATRRRVLTVVAGVGVVLVATTVALTGWARLFSPVVWQAERGLQIESVAATPAMVGWVLSPASFAIDFGRHNAYEITGAGTEAMLAAAQAATLCALAVVALLSWSAVRKGSAVGPTAVTWVALAGVASFLATSKVLSPQYLLWLLPLAAAALAVTPTTEAAPLRRWTAVLLVATGATQLVFPEMYGSLTGEGTHEAWAVTALTVRNLLVVWLAAWAVVRATRSLSAAGRSSATLPDRHGRSGASSDGATTTPT